MFFHKVKTMFKKFEIFNKKTLWVRNGIGGKGVSHLQNSTVCVREFLLQLWDSCFFFFLTLKQNCFKRGIKVQPYLGKRHQTFLPIFKLLAAASQSTYLTTFSCSNKDDAQSHFPEGLLKHFLKKMSFCKIAASKMDSFHYQALVIKGFVIISNLS